MKHILLTALFLLSATPTAAQDEPVPLPDIVERVALALIDDGVFKVNQTGTVCDGSRDSALCRQFNDLLEELLKIEEGKVKPDAVSLPLDRQPGVRIREISDKLEALAFKLRDRDARAAINKQVKALRLHLITSRF